MRKLYRSSRDRKIFGICGGLSEYLGVDATLLRILLVVVAVFSAGSVIFVYLIAGLIIPQQPNFGVDPFGDPWNGGPRAGGAHYGWTPPHNAYSSSPQQGWTPGPGPQAAGGGTFAGGAKIRNSAAPGESGGLDAMMDDIEKKALRREIEELKARIAKFEKESKGE
jgi:phage shock protein PspC (stress-responsive transcriptional regulator)